MLALILLVAAFICCVMSAFWRPSPPRVDLFALGVALYLLSIIVVYNFHR